MPFTYSDLKTRLTDKQNRFPIIRALVALTVILIAIIVLIPFISETKPGTDDEVCLKVDYTACSNVKNIKKTCFDTLKDNDARSCECNVTLNVIHDLVGNVTLYYLLESYDQTEENYSRSRDDHQLSGHISTEVSQACGLYANSSSGKLIAPCGLIADSMFNDSYKFEFDKKILEVETTGLVNKTGYRNPPAVNLAEVFKDFKKPKSWNKNIWELDPENPDNNGFQNEAFIAWMRADLKRKPVLSLKQEGVYTHGLPAGLYSIEIKYVYPLTRYNGSRIISICRDNADQNCINRDYTRCPNILDTKESCFERLEYDSTCTCYVDFTVPEEMKGKIILYYKLDSYDQTDPNYTKSRDDDQLSGKLSRNVSSSCNPYDYIEDTPIAPCGKVADSMFNDSFRFVAHRVYVDVVNTGLVDKKGYQNPPEDLAITFKDFNKPINWVKNVWELDPGNPDNNGFQNEAFIAWMRTDLKRKPAWRLKHVDRYKDGLPIGLYNILVSYEYPVERYNGSRVLKVCGKRHIPERVKVQPGPCIFLVTIILLGIVIASFDCIKNFMVRKELCGLKKAQPDTITVEPMLDTS